MIPGPAVAFDPYSDEFSNDPYPIFRRLQAESPVFYDERLDRVVFTTHRDVAGLLKHRALGRDVAAGVEDSPVARWEQPAAYPNWTKFIRGSFIDREPPDHTRLRALVKPAFTTASAREVRTRLESIARDAIDRATDRGSIEIVGDYATPIALTMIGELMGVPEADREQLVAWSHAIVRLFDHDADEGTGRAAEAAVVEFVAYLRELVELRRREPGADLLSAMTQVPGDETTDDDLIATAILTLNAGHEATVHAIGNATLALARHPAVHQELRNDRGLVTSAVEELLRYDTPLQMFERWVYADVDWRGHRLAEGTKVALLFGAANHDASVFEDPARLDIRRDTRGHLSFGVGVHHCVGSPLARVELQVAIDALAERVPVLSVEGEPPQRIRSLVFRGLESLPIRL